jgi:hypothetical protein
VSFAFTAAGRRAQVCGQLAQVSSGDAAGVLAARLAARLIDGDTDSPPGGGQEIIYVVKGSGHGGGGLAVSLELTIEPLAVPVSGPAR